MSRLNKIIFIILICLFISGCGSVPEVSRTYPVKDYIVVDDEVIAVFTINEKEKTYQFEEYLINPCKGENVVKALFWEHLLDIPEDANEIYLYLNEIDYEKYREEIKIED